MYVLQATEDKWSLIDLEPSFSLKFHALAAEHKKTGMRYRRAGHRFSQKFWEMVGGEGLEPPTLSV